MSMNDYRTQNYDRHRFPILYCCDENLRGREWLEYSLSSLFRNCDPFSEIEVFVASDTPFRREGVTWIDMNPYLEQFRVFDIAREYRHRIPPMTYMRMAAPWMYELWNRDVVFYIDIDTEICGHGLTEIGLEDFNADAKVVFEKSDYTDSIVNQLLGDKGLTDSISGSAKKRLSTGKGYFNAGVMLMNLKRLRRKILDPNKWIPAMVRLAVEHKFPCVDQDALNIVLDVVPLDSRFNYMPCLDSPEDCQPEIIHYANHEKYECVEYPPQRLRKRVIEKYGDILGQV